MGTFEFGGQTEQVKVTVKKDGETYEKMFNADVTVQDALNQISREFHLSSANITAENGADITPSQGEDTIGSVGNLTVVPKAQGA